MKVGRRFLAFFFFCAFLGLECVAEEDWWEWKLIEPSRERRFLSGGPPRAQTKPVLSGELSEKTRAIYGRWGKSDAGAVVRGIFSSSDCARELREAYDAVSGWRLPFADYCRSSGPRLRLVIFDIQLKAALAEELMRVPAVRKEDDSGDAEKRWRAGAKLFAELLDEYRPGRAEMLTREIEATPEKFCEQTRSVALERARFDCYRQRELEKIFSERSPTSTARNFFRGLETCFGNDVEAQRRFCAECGVFGKLEPSNFRRPDLARASVARDAESARERFFVWGDVPLGLEKEDDAACGFSAGTLRARDFFGQNWERAAGRLARPFPRSDLTKQEAFDRWSAAAEAAVPVLSGWAVSFDDCLRRNRLPVQFSVGDLLLKRNLALGLMNVPAHEDFADFERARRHWRQGARLFGELLAEYQPGLEEKLKAEIDASTPEAPSFPPKDTPLARARFAYARQKKIREFLERPDLIGLFLAGLETFYGNDIEAQLGICAETGVCGKLDLTKYRRPTLSGEAILQYEERAALTEK